MFLYRPHHHLDLGGGDAGPGLGEDGALHLVVAGPGGDGDPRG